MRIDAVSLFLLLPLLAAAVRHAATRDESNWNAVKSYNKAVRRHPVNPNAISQVDSDDETRAVPYYYMIVNGTTIDREVRYFLSPYQVSAVGDLHIFFLPGPLANWARNIGSIDIDPSEILERYPPVALDDLPPMPRMIRRKIRELTFGYDLLRSSGISREKYGREKASIGSKRVQSVDNSVATTTTTTTTTTIAPRPRQTRMISQARQTAKPLQQVAASKRKFIPKFDREEQSIFESIVDELVDHNDLPPSTTPHPRLANNKVARITLNPLNVVTTRRLPKITQTMPTAPPTADASLREFQFRPHSTPSTRSVDEYDEEEEEKPHVIAHSLFESKPSSHKRPTLDSDSPPRITHPRTHQIERSRLKEILVGEEEELRRATVLKRPLNNKRVDKDSLSSAEILEKLSTIRNLQAELERQLEIKGLGRKRVEASHPDAELLNLEDLSAPDTFSPTPYHHEVHEQEAPVEDASTVTTTTEEPTTTTTTEEPTTTATTEEPTTTTRRTTTRRATTTTTPRPTTTTRTTTRQPTTTTEHTVEAPPPPRVHPTLIPAPPLDLEFHAFHEDLVGKLGEIDEDPQFLPPLPSEVFSGRHSMGSFFGGSSRNERRESYKPTTTRRPTTARSTTRSATTTTTEEPTTTTEEPTTTTTEAHTTSTRLTLPTRKFVFVTSPPITTRAPTTTTEPSTTVTLATVPTPTVPEFVLDEIQEASSAPDDVKIDLRTLRALTSLSNDEIDKIRKRFVQVDARAAEAQLAPGQELDEAMFRGLQMMETFKTRAEGAKTAEGGVDRELQDLTPMSRRFVPMGMGSRLATAAAVKTKNMDVEYEYEDEAVEETTIENPGSVLVFDDEMGAHVRDTRRIRLQNLNEPLRRFEKVNNGRRDKFVFVRPDRFYDKNGVELKTTKRVDEAQLSEAIGLGSGRPVQIVSNDRRPNRVISPAAVPSSTSSSPLIGVPIHIAAVTQPTTRRLTPPPASATASPLPTRAHPRPPAHTPPIHLLPEQLQQLSSARPVQQPQAVAVQIPAVLTPPPRPLQQLQQPTQPHIPTLAGVQVPQQLQPVRPVQQLQQPIPSAVQQVVTPPPQLAQIVFNQRPVAVSLQSQQLQSQQLQSAAPAAPASASTISTTTTAAPMTTVQQTTVAVTQLQTTTTMPAATTSTAAPTAAAAAPAAPSLFLPNPAFRNPIHPSIPFTPALNGLSVNQFLQQFFAQQQAIRAAAKQLQQLQRTPKAAPVESAAGVAPAPVAAAAAAAPAAVLQYPAGFAPQPTQFFWPPQFPASPWFFPPAFGAKSSPVGRPDGDVITVPSEAKKNQSIGDTITESSDAKKSQSIVDVEQH